MASDWFSEPAAARIFEVHPDTFRRWRQQGKVSYSVTPGGRIRYSTEDLAQLRADMKVRASPGLPV